MRKKYHVYGIGRALSFREALILTIEKGVITLTDEVMLAGNNDCGISNTLDPEFLDIDAIEASEFLYLEGQLVTSPTAKKTLIAARKQARVSNTKVALTLSDPNLVRYFKSDLLAVIDGQVDLLFCNEEEALLFSHAHHLESAIALLQPFAKHLVVTCGGRGAILAIDGEMMGIAGRETLAIDTVGARDLFAGTYLYAVIHGYAPQLAVELANQVAAEVVVQNGARLSAEQILTIKDQFIASHYSFAEQRHAKTRAFLETELID